MVETREMTDWEWELWSGRTIASQLPEVWETTGFKLTDLTPQCSQCESCLRNEQMVRGKVTRISPAIVIVKMMAFCVGCNMWTADSVRIKSDKTGNSMLHTNPATGTWEETKFKWTQRFRSTFKWLFQRKDKIRHQVKCSN